MSSYDNFQDSFNGALRGGALLQGILMRSEERQFKKQVDRADSFARGLDALTNKYGSANPKDYDDVGRGLFNDLLNEYPDLTGDRPGGKATYNSIEPAGDGVAALVTVDDGKGGSSTGPITKRGSTDPDDEVVIISDVNEHLKKPIAENLRFQRAQMAARMQSPNAHKMISQRENQANEENAVEAIYQRNLRLSGPVSDPAGQVQDPAVADAQPVGLSAGAPVPQEAPAPVETGAVTSPGPARPTTPVAEARIGNYQGQTYSGKAFTPQVDSIVTSAADAAGVDPDLYRALVQTESEGDINARSGTGAQGLAQITGDALIDVNKKLGTNYTRADMKASPAKNAEVGATYLRMMLDQHDGNVEQALAAYNGGAGHLRRVGGGDYRRTRKETREYVPKVLSQLQGAAAEGVAQPGATAPADETGFRAQPPDVPAGLAENEVDLSKGKIARDRTTPPTPEETLESYQPRGKKQETVLAEAKETAAPVDVEEVKQAVDVVKKKQKAEKWTLAERKALYTLHRLNPTQMPLDRVITALETGRMTSKNMKYFQNAAGQMIGRDDEGVETVVGDTPEAQRIQQLDRDKKAADLQSAQLGVQGKLQQSQAATQALTTATTKHLLDQSVNIHGDDPTRMARHRDRATVTAESLGLNLQDQGAATVLNKAAKLQQDLDEATDPWLPEWLVGPGYQGQDASDYGAGMTVLNAPNNPFNVESADEDEREDGAEWVFDNYMAPAKKEFPDMDPQTLMGTTYLATEMMKMPGTQALREDVIRSAGRIMSSGKFNNVGEVIELMQRQNAALKQ